MATRTSEASSAQQVILAGFLYFAGVFAVGFILGTARVLLLEPTFGPLRPVLIELLIILGASWWICRRIAEAMKLSESRGVRIGMGASAFVFLMAAELTLSIAAFGRSPVDYLAAWMTPHGAAGLAGQLAFAAFPLLVRRRL